MTGLLLPHTEGLPGQAKALGVDEQAVPLRSGFRGSRRWHTSGMANPQPPDPRVEKTWVNDAGELFVSDGTGWMPYEDLPDWPDDDDLDPKALYRDPG
jgi:hypothetical protein